MTGKTLPPRILHLNVRGLDGGAARVAASLHEGAKRAGWVSRFCYGYGPSARPDPRITDADVRSVSQRARVASNYLVHWMVGRDVLPPDRDASATLAYAIAESDIVHIHDVHSYWLPLPWLVDRLRSSQAPIVWTLHNDWVLTGRCAQPGDCTRWLVGCGHCPNRRAYPPAKLDLTHLTSKYRQRVVRSIPNLNFVTCAEWMLDLVRTVYPGIASQSVANGVDPAFAAAADAALARANGWMADPQDKPHVLVAGADLGDTAKHDHQLLAKLAEEPVRITTVGKRSPVGGTNVTNLGGLVRRDRMADIYAAADLMVFTSRVDYFPLSIAECLYAGTPVVATTSPAADEVLGQVGATTVGSTDEIVKAVSGRSWPEFYPSLDRAALAARAHDAFDPEKFVESYLRLYSTVLDASHVT